MDGKACYHAHVVEQGLVVVYGGVDLLQPQLEFLADSYFLVELLAEAGMEVGVAVVLGLQFSESGLQFGELGLRPRRGGDIFGWGDVNLAEAAEGFLTTLQLRLRHWVQGARGLGCESSQLGDRVRRDADQVLFGCVIPAAGRRARGQVAG